MNKTVAINQKPDVRTVKKFLAQRGASLTWHRAKPVRIGFGKRLKRVIGITDDKYLSIEVMGKRHYATQFSAMCYAGDTAILKSSLEVMAALISEYRTWHHDLETLAKSLSVGESAQLDGVSVKRDDIGVPVMFFVISL